MHSGKVFVLQKNQKRFKFQLSIVLTMLTIIIFSVTGENLSHYCKKSSKEH